MTNIDLELLSAGFLGIMAHCLIEISQLKKKNGFSRSVYFNAEWPTISVSVIAVVVCLMFKKNIQKLEQVGDWLGFGFFAIGYMGQSILVKMMGKASALIDKIGGPTIMLALLVPTLLMASCSTVKRAAKTFDTHQVDAASYCQAKFPIVPQTITKIKNITGKPDTITIDGQTVYVNCDSAIAATLDESSRSHIGIKCPPSITVHQTDTLLQHDSTTVIDSRQHYIDQQLISDSQRRAQHWKIGCAASACIALLLLVFIFLAIKGKL